jgi:hypothetical protein
MGWKHRGQRVGPADHLREVLALLLGDHEHVLGVIAA